MSFKPLLLGTMFLGFCLVANAGDRCFTCGTPFEKEIYLILEKTTNKKREICPKCTLGKPRCAQCGLPVGANTMELTDGRVLCERDQQGAVVTDGDTVKACEKAREDLARLVSRFMTLPQDNTSFKMVDRIALQTMFKSAGAIEECPNVWGFVLSTGEKAGTRHDISVLMGLPEPTMRAVCAHELGHAWIYQNVSAERRRELGSSTVEGFCELLAYLLMDAQNEHLQKEIIRKNMYTRGQFQVMLQACEKFGLNDVVDWMQSGAARVLTDVAQVRDLKPVQRGASSPSPILAGAVPQVVPDKVTLKAILWSTARPVALINNETFAVGDQARVRLASTNFNVRCLAISQQAVRIRILETGEERQLSLDR